MAVMEIRLESLLSDVNCGMDDDNLPSVEELTLECCDIIEDMSIIEQNITAYESAKLITTESAKLIQFEAEQGEQKKKLGQAIKAFFKKIIDMIKAFIDKIISRFKSKEVKDISRMAYDKKDEIDIAFKSGDKKITLRKPTRSPKDIHNSIGIDCKNILKAFDKFILIANSDKSDDAKRSDMNEYKDHEINDWNKAYKFIKIEDKSEFTILDVDVSSQSFKDDIDKRIYSGESSEYLIKDCRWSYDDIHGILNDIWDVKDIKPNLDKMLAKVNALKDDQVNSDLKIYAQVLSKAIITSLQEIAELNATAIKIVHAILNTSSENTSK